MKGGAFLGQGAYGCSLDPAPSCIFASEERLATKTDKELTVAKIFPQYQDLHDEWQVAQKMAKLDPKQDYFLYAIAKCDTSAAAIQKVPGNRFCDLPSKNLAMLKMPYGGITLVQRAKKKWSFVDFFASLLPVMHGIKLLVKHKLVHHDLKFDNILYNPATQQCRMIDFGLLIESSKIYSNPKILKYGYWVHPPEYGIIHHISTHGRGALTSAQIHYFYKQYRRNLEIPHPSSRKTIGHLVEQYCFTEQVFENEYATMVTAIVRKRNYTDTRKIDMYALGLSILTCIPLLSKHWTHEELSKATSIVKLMIHPNPAKRISITKALTIVMKWIPT